MTYSLSHLRNKWKTIQMRRAVLSDWYRLTFPLNRLSRGRQTLHLRNGFPITVDSIFSRVPSFLISFFYVDEYRLSEITLPQKPIIVDLGANIGAFSIDAKAHFPSARIIAFEPHPETFAFLKINAPFAELHQEAASGESRAVQIETGGVPHHRTLVPSGGTAVAAKNLDEILAPFEKIDLLKADIEGAEFALFERAHPETLEKISCIVAEFHPDLRTPPEQWGSDHNWVQDFFVPRGFSVHWIWPYSIARLERL